MQATPLFLSACALASIAGVISGATINTRLIQHAGVGIDDIDRPTIAFDPSDDGLSDQVALPDHYALRTPKGLVEVSELSDRGLYAQRRFGWRDAWTPPPVPAFPEPTADAGWSYGSAEELGEPPIEVQPAINQQPAKDPQTTEGQARLIAVQSALPDKSAMQSE